MSVDLAVVAVGGVQRFIGESRSTADVSGASELLQRLLRAAAELVGTRLKGASEPCGLIFPAGSGPDVPVSNKLVFLAPAGAGAALAAAAAASLQETWRSAVAEAFGGVEVPPTPGMPDVAWAVVTGSDDDYRSLWKAAQEELVGRRRARVFAPYEREHEVLCSQSAGLPAVTPPHDARRHERDEKLSAAGWVKRRAGARAPSTVSVASSSFRLRLLRAAAADETLRAKLVGLTVRLSGAVTSLGAPRERWALPDQVEGLTVLQAELGPWVHLSRWEPDVVTREHPATVEVVSAGRSAARGIIEIADAAGIRSPSPYFAVLTQDLDRLGHALGEMSLADQRAVSAQLSDLAQRQRKLVERAYPAAHLVYTGGDDLLAFCPAYDVLGLAAALREQVRENVKKGPLSTGSLDGGPVTASTGVVFAHMSNPLQEAIAAAQDAIRRAKDTTNRVGESRDAVCVVVRRRGGERAVTVQPWSTGEGERATDLLDRARPGADGELSAGLAGVLERDAVELDSLAPDRPLLRAEIERLVLRQGGTAEVAAALTALGRAERTGGKDATFRPGRAALVARFLAQEAG